MNHPKSKHPLPDYGIWLHYDNGPEKYIIRGAMLAKSPPLDYELVLDVGSGRGIVGIGYAKQNSSVNVVCIDIWHQDEIPDNSPSWIVENSRREDVANQIKCTTANTISLPFRDETFDRVVSSMCLHNIISISHQFTAFQEIYRVLKRGGLFTYVDGRWINRKPPWQTVVKWLHDLHYDLLFEEDIVLSQYEEDRLGFISAKK